MLILSRRVGENILVGDDIVIRLLEIRSNQIRIGIDAPDDLHIVREELAVRDKSAVVPEDAA